MIDLSRGLQQQLKIAVERAVALRDEKKFAEAGDEFERCAKLMLLLVKEAISDDVKKMRQHKAKEYYELAKKLRGSSLPSGLGTEGKEPVLNEKKLAPEGKETDSRILSLLKKTEITWNDIKGLDSVVKDIRSVYVFAGATYPEGTKKMLPRSVLLYGPPGTGKTLLAAAASNELKADFFSVEVGSLLSKYFGESAQLVAELFTEARRRPRSLIFFDEIDALTPSRDKEISEAARNVLTALMTGWDGIDAKSANNTVYIMSATNCPWDIENAMLSRLGRPVYIPLPEPQARGLMFKSNIEGNGYTCDMSYETLVEKTQNYSGRDIALLCTEAVASMLINNNDLTDVEQNGILRIRPISVEEMTQALNAIRPQASEYIIKRYEEFKQTRR